MAAVGTDRVLIGAYGDGAQIYQSGLAHLLSTNGTLLVTLTNPVPKELDYFGWAVAAVGNSQVLIGAPSENPNGGFGLRESGTAYLFDLPYPQLGLSRNGAAVSLKWVSAETGLVLQQAGALGAPTLWSNSTDTVSFTGLSNVVQQTLASTNRFFRLSRP